MDTVSQTFSVVCPDLLCRKLLFLDKEHALVLEGAGPVRVHLQLSSDVLADDQLLGETLVHEAV